MSFVRQDAPPAAAVQAAAPSADSTAGTPGVAARESIPVITFLYKLSEGAADESFGLNVAQVGAGSALLLQTQAASLCA
jgi:hypothetical protein